MGGRYAPPSAEEGGWAIKNPEFDQRGRLFHDGLQNAHNIVS